MYNGKYVVANIASYPRRERGLEQVLLDLSPQVDVIRVYLNNYSYVPDFIGETPYPCELHVVAGKTSDLKAAGKFFDTPIVGMYQLYVDDDLEYPPDYVSKTLEYVDLLDRSAVITYHGVRFTELPCQSYFHSHQHFPYNMALGTPEEVHVPGTGTTAFFVTDGLATSLASAQFNQEVREHSTKVDLVLAKYLNQARIQLIAIPRQHFYLKLQERFLVDTDCIYNKSLENEQSHVDFINSVNWTI